MKNVLFVAIGLLTFVLPASGGDSTPAILVQPVSVMIAPGATTNFSVQAQGPTLAYQWWHNDVPVPGSSTSALSISNAIAGAQGDYFVVVSNFAGVVISATATLTFDSSALNILVQPKNATVGEGYYTSFVVGVTGITPLAFQWTHNGSTIPGATSSALLLPATSTNAAGYYQVAVTNGYRALTSSNALLTVVPAVPPLLIAESLGQSLIVTFNAQAGRSYRLLSSSNLTGWFVVATNSAVSTGIRQFVETIQPGRNAFYRVVTP